MQTDSNPANKQRHSLWLNVSIAQYETILVVATDIAFALKVSLADFDYLICLACVSLHTVL
jgi:hypothetical protein